MPGCAAVGCNNRSEKGYKMKCFPRDPILRKIWQERVARANWEPSNNSFLCHEHFESDKWCTMENGRVKLKKNAIPSIFTINSTRKSIKKHIMKTDDNKNNCDSVMHVENDREHTSIDYLKEKYSVSQEIDGPSIQFAHEIAQQMNNFSKSIESKQSFPVQDYSLQQEHILISDDSIKTEDVKVEVYNVEEQKDEKDEKPISDSLSNLADNSNKDLIKPELKEAAQISVHNYDEIEEKLKQICDGYFEDNNSNNMEKLHSISDNQKEVLQQASNKTPVHRSINYKYSSGNNIGHMLTNDTENIEIIFSAEDREEDTHVRKCASRNSNMADENEMLDFHNASVDSVSNDKEVEQNMNVTPNMMAAMKRKRRTRDEIMKSIEKSICNVSSQDTNSLSDSDIFDDTGKKKDRRKKIRKIQDESSSDASPATMKFTVKVTGHPDDISDIMHDLSRSTGDISLQEYNDVRSPKEDDRFVTSVITIDDDCSADVGDKTQFRDNFSSSCFGASNDRMSLPSTSKNCRSPSIKISPHSDEDLSDLSINSNRSIPVVQNTTTNDCAFTCKYDESQPNLSVQADVVKELGSQAFLCKRVEYELQNKNSPTHEGEILNMTDELHALSNNVGTPMNVQDVQQKLIDDLTSKLNRFEETNRKLVKSATTGIEQVKNLQNQLKQKDSQIKELNWKLNKASKYLERAEKNTNTYRKKMLNMQGFLKKKKFMEDRVTYLNDVLMEAVKKAYTNKVLPMSIAIKIKRICGMTEYDKLLQSGLPLPVRVVSDNLPDSDESNKILRPVVSRCSVKKVKEENTESTEIKKVCGTTEYDKLLQSGSPVRVPSDNLLDSNESNKILRPAVSRHRAKKVKKDDTQSTENHVEVDSENVESSEKITLNDTETVMGTVQDIFDESSDDDDFSTNELTEDFISQLRKFM